MAGLVLDPRRSPYYTVSIRFVFAHTGRSGNRRRLRRADGGQIRSEPTSAESRRRRLTAVI